MEIGKRGGRDACSPPLTGKGRIAAAGNWRHGMGGQPVEFAKPKNPILAFY
jgi:hypothetical protein